jgi:anti-sigma factor RsiW
MSTRRDLEQLQCCLDAGHAPRPDLLRRLEADPRLHRRARALRRVDAGLHEELSERVGTPRPSIAPRVLRALGPRPAAASPRWARGLALAAAAALVVWLAEPGGGDAATSTPRTGTSASALSTLRQWRRVAPLEAPAPGVAPIEAPLLEEGRRLAEDTRHVARSLWRGLPLAGWTVREERYPH